MKDIPPNVRELIKTDLWGRADQLGWINLPAKTKTDYYEAWTREAAIGGVLARYIKPAAVRTYIKDAIFKTYPRDRLADPTRSLEALGIELETPVAREYIKPHGRRFADGRIVVWGWAKDWKTIVTALHERAFANKEWKPHGAVLLQATGRYHHEKVRSLVEDAAVKLGIERVVWLEM